MTAKLNAQSQQALKDCEVLSTLLHQCIAAFRILDSFKRTRCALPFRFTLLHRCDSCRRTYPRARFHVAGGQRNGPAA